MSLFDDLKKTVGDAGKKAEKVAGTIQHAAENTANEAEKTANDVATQTGDAITDVADSAAEATDAAVQQLGSTIQDAAEQFNTATQQAFEFSRDALIAAGGFITHGFDQEVVPFTKKAVLHVETTSETITMAFVGEVNGVTRTVGFAIDRATTSTLDGIKQFVAMIGDEIEAILAWLESTLIWEPIAETLDGLTTLSDSAMSRMHAQLEGMPDDKLRQHTHQLVQLVTGQLNAGSKTPRPSHDLHLPNLSMPEELTELVSMLRDKLDGITRISGDWFPANEFRKLNPGLEMRYSVEDLEFTPSISDVLEGVIGRIEQISTSPDKALQAIMSGDLTSRLLGDAESQIREMLEQIDGDAPKIKAILEDLIKALQALWRLPVPSLPFFADLFRHKLKLEPTLGSVLMLPHAIETTLMYAADHVGASPDMQWTGSSRRAATLPRGLAAPSQNHAIEWWSCAMTSVDLFSEIGADRIKVDLDYRRFGQEPPFQHLFGQVLISGTKLIAVILRQQARDQLVREGKAPPATQDDMVEEAWASLFSLLPSCGAILYPLIKMGALGQQRIRERRSGEQQAERFKGKPNDLVLLIFSVFPGVAFLALAGHSAAKSAQDSRYSRYRSWSTVYLGAKGVRGLAKLMFLEQLTMGAGQPIPGKFEVAETRVLSVDGVMAILGSAAYLNMQW